MRSIILASALAFVSIGAHADNFYVLGNVGQSKLEISVGDYTVSKTETMFDLGAGYNLDETFAFELAYRDLGAITEEDAFFSGSSELSTLQLSALGKLALNEAVYVYGRLGMARMTIDYSESANSFLDDEDYGSDTKTRALFGLGAGYKVTPALSLRGEYMRHAKWEEITFSTLSIGATYSF